MGKCVRCGKKGLFLKVNSYGRCPLCEVEFQSEQRQIAAENARKIREEREAAEKAQREKELEEERLRLLKTYKPYSYSIYLDDGWYLVYSYKKVSVSVGENTYYHGDVEFVPDGDAVNISLENKIVGKVSDTKISQMIQDFLNRNEKVLGQFDSENSLYIVFYKQLLKQVEDKENIICKLMYTSKKDETFDIPRYENLEYTKDDELVKLEFDQYTGRYVVYDSAGGELGELSKSDTKKIMQKQEDGFDTLSFTTECGYNENDKPAASIKVFFK